MARTIAATQAQRNPVSVILLSEDYRWVIVCGIVRWSGRAGVKESFMLERLKTGAAVIGSSVTIAATGIATAKEPAWFKSELEPTVEAVLASATTFYGEERTSRTGQVEPRRFPASVGRTPATPACKGGKPTPNAVDASTFAAPGWQSINISPDKPLWAQYAIESSGAGAEARMVLRAYFDADCDGQESVVTFGLRADTNGLVTREKPEFKPEPGLGLAGPEDEAKKNLRKLADSSASYFAEEKMSRDGGAQPRSFPESAGRTPAQRPACRDGKPTRITPDAGQFSAPTWQALNFSVDDPFFLQYEYVSSGTGAAAKFTARAIGDADCDGVEAIYEVQGSVAKDGTVKTKSKEPQAGVR